MNPEYKIQKYGLKSHFNFVTIYRVKKMVYYSLYFSVTKKIQKVKREMDFGHF